MGGEKIIKIENLNLHVDGFSLSNINLFVDTEYFTILGRTGSGKTLLLECIAGLKTPNSGRISLMNKDITNLKPEKRCIGYVPQDYALFPHMSVEKNIKFGIIMRKMHPDKVKRISDHLDISHLLGRSVRDLSGGEKQKVALARALVLEPKVLLLDEPTAALDKQTKEEIWKVLKEVREYMDIAVIHVTHDFEEAFALGDRIAVMENGKIIQEGVPEKVFREPMDDRIANFLGARNIIEGEVVDVLEDVVNVSWNGYILEIPKNNFSFSIKDRIKLCIRPEDVHIVREDIPSKRRENQLIGRIIKVLPRGAFVTMFVGVGSEERVVDVPTHVYEKLGLFEDKEIKISLKKDRLHCMGAVE